MSLDFNEWMDEEDYPDDPAENEDQVPLYVCLYIYLYIKTHIYMYK